MLRAALSILTVIAIGVSVHGARDFGLWWLESAPVLVGFALCLATYPLFVFTDFTYGLIFISFALVLIGAHYTYGEVPFFNWLRDEHGWSRNHYDRVGHFMQGIVPAIIIRELMLRKQVARKGIWLSLMIVLASLGISALYEIAEMVASFFVKGATIDWFLGLQGDVWDTQKDMVMALLGAIAALLFLSRWHDKALAKKGME